MRTLRAGAILGGAAAARKRAEECGSAAGFPPQEGARDGDPYSREERFVAGGHCNDARYDRMAD
ncbi:MAG TPA: hypothetical protein VKF62_03250, partial [Planctomycetota bacterium]|nr:hypothetical protein [Planctomycetota bacterium]